MSIAAKFVGCCALICLGISPLNAALVPYTQDFNGLTAGTDISSSGFTEATATGTAEYSLTGSALNATVTSASGGANRAAGIAITDLGGVTNRNFVVTTDFILNSSTGSASSTLNFGLGILGDTANFSTGNQYRILYTAYQNGTANNTLSIIENTTTLATSSGTITEFNGMTGTMSITGTYNLSGHLQLDAVLTSGSSTITASFLDTTPKNGTFFGYRTAVNASGSSAALDVTYDNFSVIPEPTTYLGLALAIGAAGWYRKRKQA
jgi:hypothetical protein